MSKALLLFVLASVMTLIAPASARAPYNASLLQLPSSERLGFTSRDGLHLSYVRHPAASEIPTGTNDHRHDFDAAAATPAQPIVIAPGCAESAYRYEPLARDLITRGYGPIYVLEHRGQGHSASTGRRADLVHVDRFADYATDFTDFVRGPVARDLAARGITVAPFVIAHSMGGAVVNLALRDEPTLASKVAYFAPMWDINTAVLNPLNDRAALWAAELLCAAGFCERVGVGGPGRARRKTSPGVLREVNEGIFRGGVTAGWLKEAIRATWTIRGQARAHAEPSLVITALRDRIVGNGAIRAYARDAENCVLREIDGPHGLHQDERSREPLVNALDGFFRGCEDLLKK